MIESILLENFQGHRRLAVPLDHHVTTLVGPSDVGKSAVLRAFRWVALNLPTGTGIIRHGADVATVTLAVDGHEVVRRRGPSENVYLLDGETYKSLKAVTVPESISRLLNVAEVNFQGQLDPPFWLADTAGSVSRHLNEVVNLAEIDAALAVAAADVRAAQSTVTVTELRLADARDARDETAWVVEFAADLAAVEALGGTLQGLELGNDVLGGLVGTVAAGESRLAALEAAVTEAEDLVATGADAVRVAADRAWLAQLVDEVARHEAVLELDPIHEWEAVREVRTRADAVAVARGELDVAVADVTQLEDELCRVEEQLEREQAELEKALNGKCPTCGQPTTVDALLPLSPICTGAKEPPSDEAKRQARSGLTPRRRS